MNEIVNLCKNPRGNYFYEVSLNFYEEGKQKKDGELEYKEIELYEIRCGCGLVGYSNEEERFYCKVCGEFSRSEKKKVKMIYVDGINGNEIHPVYLKYHFPSYYPYYGLDSRFEDQIVFLDDPLMLGEVVKRSKSCRIYLFGRCLNAKKVDRRVKLLFISFTSEFEDFELDGLMVKRAERKLSEIESLKEKERDGEPLGILESIVKRFLERGISLLKNFKFWESSRIFFYELPSLFSDFKEVSYSIEEYKRCLLSYYSILDKLIGGFSGREFHLKESEESLEAFSKIEKTINDILFLKRRLPNKRVCYISPSVYFEHFVGMKEYIERKVGMEVRIVEKLPKEKKSGDVGIYLE